MEINLARMRRLMRETERIIFRIGKARENATRTTGKLSWEPHGTDISKPVEIGGVQIADLENAYREVFEELQSMRRTLDPIISRLEDPDERAVMRLRYIHGYKPDDIAEALGMTERMIYYILSKAERKIGR